MKKGTQEKPAMKSVVDLIGKHGSPEMEQLKQMLPMSETAIYKSCKNGIDAGYLRVHREKKPGVCGRRHCTYTRTDKPYMAPKVCEKTMKNRMYRERALVTNQTSSATVVPFRHWMDSALFGAYSAPFEPTITEGRVYRQPMNTFDEEELAA